MRNLQCPADKKLLRKGPYQRMDLPETPSPRTFDRGLKDLQAHQHVHRYQQVASGSLAVVALAAVEEDFAFVAVV